MICIMSEIHKNQKKADENGKIANKANTNPATLKEVQEMAEQMKAMDKILYDYITFDEVKKAPIMDYPDLTYDLGKLKPIKPIISDEFNKKMQKLYDEMLLTGNVFIEKEGTNDSATKMATILGMDIKTTTPEEDKKANDAILILTSDFIIPPNQLLKVKADFHKRGDYNESISCPKCQSSMNRYLLGYLPGILISCDVYFYFCYDCNTIWSKVKIPLLNTEDFANKTKLEWKQMIKNYLTNLGIVAESSKETVIEEF